MAKFRCGTAPIRIETGRYERLLYHERLCPFCDNYVEDECHVLTQCSLDVDLRNELYDYLSEHVEGFYSMSDIGKTLVILSCADFNTIRRCANFCKNILERRYNFLNNSLS